MKTLTILFLSALAFLSLFVQQATATHPCKVQQVVAYPQVAPIVYQSVYYQIAPHVTYGQLMADQARDREELRLLRQQVESMKGQTAPEVAPQKTSMIAQKCASCHTGAVPKAGLFLDGQTEVGCSSITEALRQIANGTMPPPESGITLTPAEKGQLMQELLDLERKDP